MGTYIFSASTKCHKTEDTNYINARLNSKESKKSQFCGCTVKLLGALWVLMYDAIKIK